MLTLTLSPIVLRCDDGIGIVKSKTSEQEGCKMNSHGKSPMAGNQSKWLDVTTAPLTRLHRLLLVYKLLLPPPPSPHQFSLLILPHTFLYRNFTRSPVVLAEGNVSSKQPARDRARYLHIRRVCSEMSSTGCSKKGLTYYYSLLIGTVRSVRDDLLNGTP